MLFLIGFLLFLFFTSVFDLFVLLFFLIQKWGEVQPPLPLSGSANGGMCYDTHDFQLSNGLL